MSSGQPQLDTNDESSHLPRVALSDRVKEYIIEAVLNGELKPGDRIVESSMARRLGVSQAPVREAIRDLVLLARRSLKSGHKKQNLVSSPVWKTKSMLVRYK